MHYLDTRVCVEFLRGKLRYGYQLLRSGRPGDFRIPAIVAAELWFGAEHSTNPKHECRVVEQFLEAFEIVPFDVGAAREYGRLRQTLGEKGMLIGDRDLMIAATALAGDAILVTNNVAEFERVPGLTIESWADVEL